MDIVKIALLGFFLLPSMTYASVAGTEIANIQSWLNEGSQGYYKPGTGEQWVRNQAGGDRFIKVDSTINYKAANGRTYPVVIEKTGQIDGTKIGKAAVKLAKAFAPITLGLAVYDVVCELSDICKATDTDEWVKTQPGTFDGQYATCEEAAGYPSPPWSTCTTIKNNNPGTIYWFRSPAPQIVTQTCIVAGTAGWSYSAVGYKNCSNPPPPTEQPITEQDWTTAEDLLNDPRFDEPLLVNGQPVPLANLPIFGNQDPIPLSDIESINKDSQGNVTGTTRTITTLELSDTATESRPGSVSGTEKTVKTDYDSSGQPTGTQTSTSNPAPAEKETEPTTISFDTVDDIALEEQALPGVLPDPISWGEGVCPPDINLGKFDLTYDMQPACDFATGIRPAIIFMASIVAMFIVAGVRIES